jgi:predicted P-loop ATPase
VKKLTVNDLPDRQYVKGPDSPLRLSQPLTEANLLAVLDFLGCTLRYNMQLGAVEFLAGGQALSELDQDRAYIAVMDTLKMVDIKAQGGLDFMISTLAQQSKYHPMQAWLAGLGPWDGVDRIGQLAATVETENPLWPVYLENWLVQVVHGVCAWADPAGVDGLPYVLVLVGAQGAGKTRWLSRLGGRWIKTEAELHLASSNGKDHQIEALRWPMVELAELDGIFRKSDISHMKSFISRSEDSIREPYARKAVLRPRMTAFCGSVNDDEFLTDASGSRRFWPVQVDSISWSFEMDWSQLWAQAYEFWQENPAFDLTPEQDRERAEIADKAHVSLPPEVERVAAYWEAHKHLESTFQPMNRSEIFEMIFRRSPSPVQASNIGIYLINRLGKHKTLSGKQRSWLFPYNEFAFDFTTWPKRHLHIC